MREIICIISGAILASIICLCIFNHEDICTNNDTRDELYEQYVEGAMHYDPVAYDSIKHSDKYQKYINAHGEWFNNLNY